MAPIQTLKARQLPLGSVGNAAATGAKQILSRVAEIVNPLLADGDKPQTGIDWNLQKMLRETCQECDRLRREFDEAVQKTFRLEVVANSLLNRFLTLKLVFNNEDNDDDVGGIPSGIIVC